MTIKALPSPLNSIFFYPSKLVYKGIKKIKSCSNSFKSTQRKVHIEKFEHPYKVAIAVASVWFHLHANRDYCFEKVKKTKKEHPELFISPDTFVNMTYYEAHKIMDYNVPTLFQRSLFALVHKMGLKTVKSHLWMLDKIKV